MNESQKEQARRGAHRRALLRAARKARDPARRSAQAREQRLWEVAGEYVLWRLDEGARRLAEASCPHDDVQPVPGDEDWGRCVACGDEGFPLTERAAYGDVSCHVCHDTGMVSVDMAGKVVVRQDGTTFAYEPGGFADAKCPTCDSEEVAGTDDGG